MKYKFKDIRINISILMDKFVYIDIYNISANYIKDFKLDLLFTDKDETPYKVIVQDTPIDILPNNSISLRGSLNKSIYHIETPVVISNINKLTKYGEHSWDEVCNVPYFDVENHYLPQLNSLVIDGSYKNPNEQYFNIETPFNENLTAQRFYYSNILKLPYEINEDSNISIEPLLDVDDNCYSIKMLLKTPQKEDLHFLIIENQQYPEYIINTSIDSKNVLFALNNFKLINKNYLLVDLNPIVFTFFTK